METAKLPLRNLIRKPGRSASLLLFTVLLAFTLFGGSLVVESMKSGLSSLEGRLGADIILVPNTAKSKTNLDTMILNGTTGYFYMSRDVLEKVRATDGVEIASPQLFLVSLRAECCSIPVQVIGFDPETDFMIQPWIAESYTNSLGLYDVVVGSRVNASPGTSIKIYGQNCKVAARLENTGTGLDTAVYCNMETIRSLMRASEEQGHSLKISGDPESVVSAIYVRVAEDADVQKVTDDLNLHIRKVQATRTKNMITGVSDGLSGVSATIRLLMLVVWLLVVLILILVNLLLIRERKKEFAVYRVIGMSQKMLASLVLLESVLISIMGYIAGTALSLLILLPFSTLIETRLGLPYLTPDLPRMTVLAAETLAVLLITAPLTSAISAFRLSRTDAGLLMREGV